MGNLTSAIALLASQNPFLAYFIIYLATIFLGNISAFVSFWIIAQTNFGFWGFPLLILVIFISDFSGDLLWYSLGRKSRDTRFGEWVKNHLPGHKKAEKTLQHQRQVLDLLLKIHLRLGTACDFFNWLDRHEVQGVCEKFQSFRFCSGCQSLLALPTASSPASHHLSAVADFKKFEWNFLIGIALFVFLDYIVARGIGKLLKKIIKNGETEL